MKKQDIVKRRKFLWDLYCLRVCQKLEPQSQNKYEQAITEVKKG